MTRPIKASATSRIPTVDIVILEDHSVGIVLEKGCPELLGEHLRHEVEPRYTKASLHSVDILRAEIHFFCVNELERLANDKLLYRDLYDPSRWVFLIK